MRVKHLLMIMMLLTAFIFSGCNPENRQNSLGKEDSVRGRTPPRVVNDNTKLPQTTVMDSAALDTANKVKDSI